MSRSRRRGAAMVEALVAIPMLIVITLGLIAVHSAHQKRNQVQRQADAKVYPKALPGCPSGGDDSSLSVVDGKLSEAKQYATGETLRAPLDTSIQSISDSAEARSVDEDFITGTGLSARAKVLCNEHQQGISRGDVDQVARRFFQELMN